MMRAAVYHGAHDVRIVTIEHPGRPAPDEVLIEVLRVGLCGTDAAEFTGGPKVIPLTEKHGGSGHFGPVVLGHEFMGRIVEKGSRVSGLQVGQRVVPGAGVYCGECAWCREGRPNLCVRYYTLGLQADGGLAQFVRAPANICVPVPDGCSDDVAALAQPLSIALHALDRAQLHPSDTLVVTGAGGIGGFLVAAAAARGSAEIIAIDIAEPQLAAARQLGATTTINASTEDVIAEIRRRTNGAGAAVVMEASGAAGSLATAIKVTRRGGRVVLVGIPKAPTTVDTADVTLREIELTGSVAHICDRNLPEALEILNGHPELADVVDRVIELDDLVADGLEPLSGGQIVGKVLIRLAD